MTVTHPEAVRNLMADTVLGLINAGSGNGQLVFRAVGGAEVATLTFSKPAFSAAVAGVAVAAAIANDDDATGGTIATADLVNSDGTVVTTCSVTAVNGGGDIVLNSVVLAAGQEMTLTSLTYAAPP